MWDVEQDEQGDWWVTFNDERLHNLGPDGEGDARWRAETENDLVNEERRLDEMDPYPNHYVI